MQVTDSIKLPAGYEQPDMTRGIPEYGSDGRIVAYLKVRNPTQWRPVLDGGRIAVWHNPSGGKRPLPGDQFHSLKDRIGRLLTELVERTRSIRGVFDKS